MAAESLEGRLQRLVRHEDVVAKAERVIIDCDSKQLESNFIGSPVLNEREQVVAMYSRPTPAADPEQPPPGTSFDAVHADCIRQFLAGIK